MPIDEKMEDVVKGKSSLRCQEAGLVNFRASIC